MEAILGFINKHFTFQLNETQEGFEKQIYFAKVQWTKVLISSALNGAMYGTSLLLTYALCGKVMRAAFGNRVLPPLSSYLWKGALVLLPVMAYRIAQVVVGILVHPITFPFVSRPEEKGLPDPTFKVVPFTVRSGLLHDIDARLLKNPNLKEKEGLKGRCILFSVGNAMGYESMMSEKKIYEFAKKLNANVLVYNYAGVNGSSGLFPNQDAIVASHSAICDLLENFEVREIVDFGYSIGGGVKWKDHGEKKRDGKRYCSVDYKTFRSTKRFGDMIAGPLGAIGISFLCWNYDNEAEIKRSNAGKIVVAKGSPSEGIVYDGVIPADNSLGQDAPKGTLVYSQSYHNSFLTETEIDQISIKVNEYFGTKA